MNISYTKQGDYLLLDLILKGKKQYIIGKYGLLRLKYIKKYKLELYFDLIVNNYLKEFIIPYVVAFYIADSFYKKVLSKAPLYNHINSAIDVFNVRCDIDKLIPSIKKILRIKYNLKIVNYNSMILKKFIKVITLSD